MSPDDSVQFAAQAMDELDVGSLPICDDGRLVGMVTDRDIVVRAVAQGRSSEQTTIRDVMSGHVRSCFEDQPVEEATVQMRQARIRRLPVLNRRNQLVGMLALGDIAAKLDGQRAGDVLSEVSEPAAPDRSSTSTASGTAGGGSASGRPSRMPG